MSQVRPRHDGDHVHGALYVCTEGNANLTGPVYALAWSGSGVRAACVFLGAGG